MGSLGVPEMVFIFVLALLLFGPKKLPEVGRTIGKAMSEFRRASSELKAYVIPKSVIHSRQRQAFDIRFRLIFSIASSINLRSFLLVGIRCPSKSQL